MKNRASMQGGASILIILLMIALSAFGLLALYSARSDYRLAEKNAEWTQKYYALDSLARTEAARLDRTVRAFEHFTEAERDIILSLGWSFLPDDPHAITKTVDLDAMHMVVTLALPTPGEDAVTVLEWRETQDGFVYDEGLDIWLGE